MTNQILNIVPEHQAEFFLPVIDAYVEKLNQAFSQTKKKDYSQAEWQLILEDGHIGKLLNQHMLMECWPLMQQFLQKRQKLFAFIEERQKGLVEIKFKIWLFFTADTATNFFKNQIDRPKNFNSDAFITLPYIKLLEPIISRLDRVLLNVDQGLVSQMDKCLEILDYAEFYLEEQDFSIFDGHFKKGIVKLILSETKSLLQEITNVSASPVLLEKRLNSLFKIGWRYFRTKNQLESDYFKKLLSNDPKEQEKGLKLTFKKVADFKKSMADS